MSLTEDEAERRFIEKLQHHDERAFNDLVRIYEARVFRLLVRMLGRRDEAEDMAQEVFVQVFKSIADFRGESKLSTWVYRIAVNLCKNRIKYLSRRQREQEQELRAETEASETGPAAAPAVARPDQVIESYQTERVILTCIQELDPEFREVLILRDVEDLSYEEVCEVTGLAEGTVKSRLHRARAVLRGLVSGRLGSDGRGGGKP